jgi:hypothetical protein
MIKCPVCHFDNEEGALFCDHCKSDLATAGGTVWPSTNDSPAFPETEAANPHPVEAPESAMPVAAVAEVAMPLSAVAVAEAAINEAVPIAQVDAGLAAAAEVPIAVAVPLPETGALTLAPEGLTAASTGPAAPTAPDTTSPLAAAQPETATPPAAGEPPGRLPREAKPGLVVLRGQRINVEYPLYEGDNYLGRADEKAVDIDLEDQEPSDRIWSSRQHALITLEGGLLTIEDLNSTNGTFVNRLRVHPGQKRPLQVNDVIQIGTVQLKVKI